MIVNNNFSYLEIYKINDLVSNQNTNPNDAISALPGMKDFLRKLSNQNIDSYNEECKKLYSKNKSTILSLEEENKSNIEKIQKLLKEYKLKKKENNRDINEWGIKTGLPWFCVTVLVLFLSTVIYNSKWKKSNPTTIENNGNTEHLSKVLIEVITVLLLTLTILILGLSNILKENVLGTLIGGIAGYILNRTKDTTKP
jgi:hypothetical protein